MLLFYLLRGFTVLFLLQALLQAIGDGELTGDQDEPGIETDMALTEEELDEEESVLDEMSEYDVADLESSFSDRDDEDNLDWEEKDLELPNITEVSFLDFSLAAGELIVRLIGIICIDFVLKIFIGKGSLRPMVIVCHLIAFRMGHWKAVSFF